MAVKPEVWVGWSLVGAGQDLNMVQYLATRTGRDNVVTAQTRSWTEQAVAEEKKRLESNVKWYQEAMASSGRRRRRRTR